MTDLPPGFVLDQPSTQQSQQGGNGLPDGFVLDAPQSGGVQTVPASNGRPTRVIMNMGEQKPSVVEDAAKSFGSGVVRGVAGMVGLPSLLRQGVDLGITAVGDKLGIPRATDEEAASVPTLLPSSKAITDTFEKNVAPLHDAQTRTGRYAERVGEYVPAAAGGLTSLLLRGVLPAAADQTVREVVGDKAGAVLGPIAGIATGGASALASRPSTATQALASQLPEGVTPQMINSAESLIKTAQSHGIDLSWPEALSQVAGRPILTNMMRQLEGAPQTEARMAEFFGNRPGQVQSAVGNELSNIAPVNPSPSTIGPAVGQAAEGTINDVRGAINNAAKPVYDRSATIELSPSEMARVEALPGYTEARNAVRSDPQLNRYVSNLPDNSVGFLNEVKKYLDTAGQNASAPVNAQRNMQRAAGYGSDASAVRNAAVNASPDYGAALAIESVGREKYLQPLLDGPLGKIASRDTATRDAINALFPQNPLPNSEHEISTAVSALSKRNPKAAADLVRAHVESVFNQSAKDLQSGANQAGGAKFRTALVGNPQQRLNLREAIEALPNGTNKWKGFNNLLDVLEATGTRQNIGSKTAYNQEFMKEAANSKLPAEALKAAANPVHLLKPLADKYERYRLGSNLNELANVVTDPRSGDLLRALAKEPPTSVKAQVLTYRLLSSLSTSRQSQSQVTNQSR